MLKLFIYYNRISKALGNELDNIKNQNVYERLQKEIIRAKVKTKLASVLLIHDLPLFTCYDKETKMTINP